MKFSQYVFGGVSALMAAGACTSCSNDDFDGFAADTEARMVEMTVTLEKGDVEDDMPSSRTTLVENGGDLTCLWEESDRVLIATADGKPAGVLTLAEGAGQATATFSGQVDANIITDASSSTYVYIHYFGTEVDPASVTAAYTHNFSSQPGTRESLSYYDYFRNTVGIKLSGDILTTNYTAKLSRVTAFGRFHLNFSDGTVLPPDAVVTVTGSFLHTVGNFGLKDQCTFDVPSSNTITTAVDPSNGDIWLTILPSSAPKTTSLTFTVTAGDKTYTGTLAERQWKANEYVRATLEDGTFAGIPVEMTPTSGGDVDPGETNEYGEPLNNPLARWAKGNLYRVDGLTNGILSDETDNGALYQWGRNYGYMDSKGIYSDPNKLYIPQTDFINYAEAQGNMTYDLPNGVSMADFYAYKGAALSDFKLCVGLAAHSNGSEIFFDRPYEYSSVTDLTNNPTKYFMDATPNGVVKKKGSAAKLVEWNGNQPDYWLDSFGDGGNTWSERAEKCGYDNVNPCPEGWRLPTLAEFKAIAPEGDGYDASSFLQTLLNQKGEVREYNGYRYAIRWIYNENYIQIESVLVDGSITESSQLTSLFWDQHVDDKVVRRFPYTGAIEPLVMSVSGLYVDYNELIVRPFYRGASLVQYNYSMLTVTIPYYHDMEYSLIDPEDMQLANTAFGGYWVEEKGWAFKFVAGEKYKTKVQSACLLVENAEPVMAYAIRPVRDYSK